MKIKPIIILFFVCVIFSCEITQKPTFDSAFPSEVERVWIGPDYWANRLQDWQVKNGYVECVEAAPNRNLFLLTYEVLEQAGDLNIDLTFDPSAFSRVENPDSVWFGLRLGIHGEFDDYRDNAVHGTGTNLGITASGKLFFGSLSDVSKEDLAMDRGEVHMHVHLNEAGSVELRAKGNDDSGQAIEFTKQNIEDVSGGIAIVSHFEGNQHEPDPHPIVRIKDWKISGSRLGYFPERSYGPVLFAQHTLSKNTLKMTAQMPPIGKEDDQSVDLELKRDDIWRSLASADIDPMARTATFKIENWESEKDISYRLAYSYVGQKNTQQTAYFEGVIRKDPTQKEEVIVAGFTGNNDLGFPNNDLVGNVVKQDPDLLFFSGDQIYEGVGGYGPQRAPVDKSTLDYLRKWYIFGWTFADLMRDRPSVAIPDDHDVYHGNIWGEGGKAADTTPKNHSDQQDTGGFKQPAEWVNMVQRTQTAHLPDPYDPTPVLQDIGVYYTEMVYGGISFAIIEDRKFKSAPRALLPKGDVRNGWVQNRNFNAKTQGDAKGAVLLGERQLTFLEDWAADYSKGIWMKMVLSQTIFANVATLPKSEFHDRIVPRLRILEKGEYAEGDRPVADMDSNGWPQTGRNNALKIIRKGFAFHLAGDQHLGSTIQYGVDEWGDAGFALCVPSVSNVWPRRWYPEEEGRNRPEGAEKNMGDFEDGFGNKITVKAVSNPYFTGRKPSRLYDRATGYGIVKLKRETREIEMANWERDIDPTMEGAKPYAGWPVRTNQLQQYGREAVSHLNEIQVKGMDDPVIQVIDAENEEIVYTLRIKGNSFRPKVFKKGYYNIKVGEPGTDKMRTLYDIEDGSKSKILVEF